jgi:hypothetical protein
MTYLTLVKTAIKVPIEENFEGEPCGDLDD